ncbi:protein unc-93 homolog A-like isoform X2 [Styela clava]
MSGFGCKYAFLIGEIAHLLYIVANFYPVKYVMIISGVIVGVGEGMIWTTVPVFSTFFGIQHGSHGSKHRSEYIRKYAGIFFGVYFAGQIFGSAMTYAILHKGETHSTPQNDMLIQAYSTWATETNLSYATNDTLRNVTYVTSTMNSKPIANMTLGSDEPELYRYCGANDCQNPEITQSNLHNYVPADKLHLNILLSVFTCLCVIGIFLHICYLPVAKPETNDWLPEENANIIDSKSEIEKHKDHSVKATLIAIFKHSTNFMQILLLPALLYHGLMYGFYLGELVRAYTSCILGVEHVGLSLVAISISSAISSVLSGKLIGLLGRNITIAILLVGETLAYVFCLLWRPNEDSKSLVYAIFVVFGVTYSCWKMCIISMYTDYFPKNQEIAYTVWSIWILIGIAISFVWSPLLCVRAKLYVHCVVLLLSVSCYGVAEFFYKSNYQSRELNIEVEPDEKQLFQEKDEQ